MSGDALGEPLRLLAGFLREGEPLPEEFLSRLRAAVDGGYLEVFSARLEGRTVGALTLAFRPSIAAGGLFASIEDLYVEPGTRRRGVGAALLERVAGRCGERNISYVEVQVEDEEAVEFYAALGFEEDVARVLSRSYPLAGDDSV